MTRSSPVAWHWVLVVLLLGASGFFASRVEQRRGAALVDLASGR
jgi:hypothetical protein